MCRVVIRKQMCRNPLAHLNVITTKTVEQVSVKYGWRNLVMSASKNVVAKRFKSEVWSESMKSVRQCQSARARAEEVCLCRDCVVPNYSREVLRYWRACRVLACFNVRSIYRRLGPKARRLPKFKVFQISQNYQTFSPSDSQKFTTFQLRIHGTKRRKRKKLRTVINYIGSHCWLYSIGTNEDGPRMFWSIVSK